MKNFGITFFIFLVWSFFSLWLYSWLIPNNNIAINKNNVTNTSIVDDLNVATKEATENPLVKSTQINEITPIENTKTNTNSGLLLENEYGDAVFNFEESISYIKNSSELSIPESLKKFYKTIRTYLENNPNTEVHIISKYSAAENLETPNLGIKRGQHIADLLKNNNISKEKIVIKSIIDDLDFDVNDRYENAISFQFAILNKERIDALPAEFVSLPTKITFYPKFSSSGILKNDRLKETMERVSSIMKQYPGSRITIIGHTDDIGEHSDNYQKGLKFSEQVQKYFIAQGKISKNRIEAMSKGEIEPIDSNLTIKGRNINQRVEIQFR